ncbi:hypothetical protein KEM54_005652 [Ascosphaera aggregata]|nr:hypothetical protein KEM54_005652 [Ascosphaera aggregata]
MSNLAVNAALGVFKQEAQKRGKKEGVAYTNSVGNLADVVLALNLLRKCGKIDHGLPSSTRARMLLNIAIDFVVGLVPIAGDIADAFYKCNTRNLLLLEGVLRKRAAEAQAHMDALAASEEEHAGSMQMNHSSDAHRHGHNQGTSTGGYTSRETSRSREGDQGPVSEYSAIGHGHGGGGGDGDARANRGERSYHNHVHHQ